MGGPGLNTTDPDAASIHGTNPQNLVEKILRMRIYDHRYWKEHCFALSAETLVDKVRSAPPHTLSRCLFGCLACARALSLSLSLWLSLSPCQPDTERALGMTSQAIELQYVGGTFGGNRMPTPFICLVLKMLQIQPEKEIVVELIKNEECLLLSISLSGSLSLSCARSLSRALSLGQRSAVHWNLVLL